ncbi:PA-phosphatase [Brevundimonas sp.]|uniref:PA-phosphatase n=1 Tax=Brevundimonas sp. TaxID=1871086 RepID=UPI002730FBA1|nr:PA-phosphatase [Brevundimonas sp.]MDP1912568.1 PA-phosphatase [Brevundimonas sp.]
MKPAAVLAAGLLMGGCAAAGGPPALIPPPSGYLPAEQIGGLAALSIPAMSSPNANDLATVHAVSPGTDRWWLATAHAELRAPEAAQHFDCLLSARLNQRPRPALARVMNRLLADAEALVQALAPLTPDPAPKRPVALIAGLEPCQRLTPESRAASAWPAGGAIVAAAYGELFAALAPDRADGARRMGREIAFSRAVCRVNWASDVEAGIGQGVGLFARASAQPEFQAELEAARAEVAAARAEGLIQPSCAAERRALRQWSAPAAIRPDAG